MQMTVNEQSEYLTSLVPNHLLHHTTYDAVTINYASETDIIQLTI